MCVARWTEDVSLWVAVTNEGCGENRTPGWITDLLNC